MKYLSSNQPCQPPENGEKFTKTCDRPLVEKCAPAGLSAAYSPNLLTHIPVGALEQSKRVCSSLLKRRAVTKVNEED